jgi:N-acetylmuramoyl-L-alanine amidase
VHHTASKTTAANDIAYILRGPPNPTPGRPNLAPIANLYLARDGVFHVLAAGRAVTNGTGSSKPWNGGVPDNEMNSNAIAIEAANDGVGEPWPRVQCEAYVKGAAAIVRHYAAIPLGHVRAHAEWSPGRKIDPAGPTPSHPRWGGVSGRATWNMDEFRADVLRALQPVEPPKPPDPPQPPPYIPGPPIIVEDDMQVTNPPKRLLDTRQTHNPLRAGEPFALKVGESCRAVMVNIVALSPSGDGHVNAWGAGERPQASALNYTKGETIANAVIVPVDGDVIRLQAHTGLHVIVDLQAVWP